MPDDSDDRPQEEAAAIAGSGPTTQQSSDGESVEKQDDCDEPDPIDVFVDANTKFQEQLEELDEDEPGFAARQMRVVDEFLKSFKAVDPPNHVRDQIASVVKEHTNVSKKSARRELQNYVREHTRETRDRPELSQIVREQVTRVECLAANETDSDVRYRFVLDDGGSIVVDEEGLWSATTVRRSLAGHFGRVPVFDPPEELDWETLVDEIFDAKLIIKRDEVGPRMQVVERVRELVEKHAAHTDIATAYTNSGVYIETPDDNVVWVESSRIQERAKEFDETLEGVRYEFDDKGLRVGQSERKRCGDGKKKNWWPLDREEFEPKRVEQPDETAGDGGEA